MIFFLNCIFDPWPLAIAYYLDALKGFTLLLVKYVSYYDLQVAYLHDVQKKLTKWKNENSERDL